MNCKDCRYFENNFKVPDRKKVDGYGECRQKSPISTVAISPWPTVHEDDWCGEFRKSHRAATQQSKPK